MGKKVILLLMFIFMFSFVTAVPPVTTVSQFTEGYVVFEAQQAILELGHDYSYHYFLYNSTNGKVIDNDTTTCSFFMANNYGEILEAKMVEYILPGEYWEVNISGLDFDYVGEYSYGLNCQDGVGGALAGTFEVTITGRKVTSGQATLYLIMTMFLLFIFGLVMWGWLSIHENTKDDEGYILEISKLAYFKPILLGFAWILLCAITFIAANISIAYLDTGLMGAFLFVIWQIMMLSNLVILPLCIIRMIQKAVLGKEMLGLIERGVEFK